MNTTKKEKDIETLKLVSIAIIDNVVAGIDNSINQGKPILGLSWGLMKSLYGASIELRKGRALEFVEFIRDNPEAFTKQLTETEAFLDGFIYSFNKFLNERSKGKRELIKNIFLGYSKASDKENFRLEAFLVTLEQVTTEEMLVLKVFIDGTISLWLKEQFPDISEEKLKKDSEEPLNALQLGDLILNKMCHLSQFGDVQYAGEVFSRLTGLGLFVGGIENTYNFSSSTFKISSYGKEFCAYLFSV